MPRRAACSAALPTAYLLSRPAAARPPPAQNSAPGAEEAFKRVGMAVATLTDDDKKAHYDRYGVDENGGGGAPGGGGDNQG